MVVPAQAKSFFEFIKFPYGHKGCDLVHMNKTNLSDEKIIYNFSYYAPKHALIVGYFCKLQLFCWAFSLAH